MAKRKVPDEHPYAKGRVCTSCGEFKTIEHFNTYKEPRAKYGVTVNGKCKPCTYEAKIPGELKRRYGITLDEYWEIFESQNGGCAICGSETANNKRATKYLPLFIDHCHSTNKVRGLLCSNCNHGLGQFKDSPELLDQAIQYVIFHREQ